MSVTFGHSGIRPNPSNNRLTFNGNFLAELDRYQSDGIDYLYDVEPQSQNLFWAGYFRQSMRGNAPLNSFYNASYRIRKIKIPMPQMETEIHNELRLPIFRSANYSQEVSIDWFEDVYHSVQKYHLDWFNRWYNREFDVLRCGLHGKFRQLSVVAYHYINSESKSLIETPIVQPIFAFHIGGLIPASLPDMTFDHSSDQNDSVLSMTYRCGRIQWTYSDKIGYGENDKIGDIWNPYDFVNDGTGNPEVNDFEARRVAREAAAPLGGHL